MTGRLDSSFIIKIAIAGAAFTMVYQVAGKAARDALFLSNFGPEHLPAMVITGAGVAILLGLLGARLLAKHAPARLIPGLMTGSGILQAAEWLLYADFPAWTAIAVYIHVVSLGAVITSGFWSVVNEQIDPHTAKRNFGRITAAGTAGGAAGGLLAERIAATSPPESVLFLLCCAQLITAILLRLLPRTVAPASRIRVRARDVMRGSAYLRNLSLLVVLGTFSAALLDYVLKVQARNTLGPGEPLMRFFAVFHTGTAVLSFVLQAAATPVFLSRWGLGATVATLPAAVSGGGLVAALAGGFPVIVAARALEAVIRGSFFRAGYELFYTPMLASEKRAVKSINDVTVDRLGDALGGGFAQVVQTAWTTNANPVLLLTAAAASGISWTVAARLNQAYVKSLERSLTHHADEVGVVEAQDATTRRVVRSASAHLETLLPGDRRVPPLPWLNAVVTEQWRQLVSKDRDRIRMALASDQQLNRVLVQHVIPLLNRKSVAEEASRALAAVARQNVGQLSDHLLDPSTPLAVRSALPAIIAAAGNDRAADALLRGLSDEQFDVRFQCGRALDSLRQGTDTELRAERVYAAVRRELEKGPDLEHVFSLLGVVLPREAVRVAFEALAVDDPQLRGLALEYLETALPPDIGESLLRIVDGQPGRRHTDEPADVLRQELTRRIHHIRSELRRVTGSYRE